MATEKCSYLTGPGKDDDLMVTLNGKDLSTVRTETYLSMTLSSAGLTGTKSETILRSSGNESNRMHNSGWWFLALKPGQIAPDFNATVRSKYRYGLTFVGVTEEMLAGERNWI